MTESASGGLDTQPGSARVFQRPDPTAGTQLGLEPTVVAEETGVLPASGQDTSVLSRLGKFRLGSLAPTKADPAGAGQRTPAVVAEERPHSNRPARRARLRISRLDPWSVMKTSFMFSIAFAIITFVAVWVLWAIVDASGTLDEVQSLIDSLAGNPDGSGGIAIGNFVDQWRVLGFTAIWCVVSVVLTTALATLMGFLYNLAAGVLGGLEVTLAED